MKEIYGVACVTLQISILRLFDCIKHSAAMHVWIAFMLYKISFARILSLMINRHHGLLLSMIRQSPSPIKKTILNYSRKNLIKDVFHFFIPLMVIFNILLYLEQLIYYFVLVLFDGYVTFEQWLDCILMLNNIRFMLVIVVLLVKIWFSF